MQKLVGKYLLVHELGKGQFGSVYKALNKENGDQEVAVKVVAKERVNANPVVSKLFKSEIEIMKNPNLKHRNLLHLLEFIETGSNYYVVVPYCKDGDLEKRLEKIGVISEPEAVYYLRQIMLGFMVLHQNKIMHRDFKLANLFLDGRKLVIGDFGFAKSGVDVATTKLGTPYNMAPEVIFSNGNTPYTSKADLWSIGVVYYQMLFGRLPFKAMTMEELKNEIRTRSGDSLVIPPNIQVSQESRNLLRDLLEFDPISRISWKKFFNHPLFEKFKSTGFSTLESGLNQSLHHAVPNNHPKFVPQNQPFSQQDVVEIEFLQKKKEADLRPEFSTNFEIPYPVALEEYRASTVNYPTLGGYSFADQPTLSMKKGIDNCNNFFTHERNKHLLLFQTTKRVKDLMKVTEMLEKHGHFQLLALCLCKRGLNMVEALIRTLSGQFNLYNLEGFREFCESPLRKKLIEAIEEDKRNSVTYLQHLESKLEEPMMKKLDPKTLDMIRASTADENILATATEKLLVHLCTWMKSHRVLMSHNNSRLFLTACVYSHYTISLSS